MSPLVAEGLLEDRYHSTAGRTSTAPPMRVAGIRYTYVRMDALTQKVREGGRVVNVATLAMPR